MSLSSFTKDITVWSGYDFTLPIYVQDKTLLIVGKDDILSQHIWDKEACTYYPANLSNSYNKVVFTVTNAFTKSCKKAILYSYECTIQPVADIGNSNLTNTIYGKFGLYTKIVHIHDTDCEYMLLHLPHNITETFAIDTASYKLELIDDEGVTSLFIHGKISVLGKVR